MNERHKELKSNDLATWLEGQATTAEKYLKPTLLGILGIGIVLLIVFTVSSMKERASGEGWAEYLEANGDNAALRAVAKRHKGDPVGTWALVSRATNELTVSSARIYSSSGRAEATEAIDSAIDDFKQVVDATKGRKTDLSRVYALFGLAQAHEMKFEIDEARELYQQVQEEAAQLAPTVAAEAQRRATSLEDDSLRDFYVWYAKQTPPEPGMMPPRGDVPEVSDLLPNDLTTLPDFPNLSIPSPAPLPEVPPQPEPKAEPKGEPKAEPKDEPKAEPKGEPKAEPKDEPKAEPKDEAQPAEKASEEKSAEPTSDNNGDQAVKSDEPTEPSTPAKKDGE